MLHRVQADQSARSPKAGLAVYGKWTSLVFCDVQELANDVPRGAGAICEIQVHVLDAVINEPPLVVHLPVQADDKTDPGIKKHGHVILGGPRWKPILVDRSRVRPRERQHPAWEDPAEVPVLHLLKKFIGFDIEALPVEQLEPNACLEPMQAVEDRKVEGACGVCRGVPVGQQGWISEVERCKHHIRRLPLDNHQVRTDEVCCI
mmetsp:Transcript_148581/g.413962  ORF Transcript_148581/g.413962 Transcript_148581/m.413962 type:complete len:204 (+) Transcript_148581:447-1058(+)